jgi:hypothetical protein
MIDEPLNDGKFRFGCNAEEKSITNAGVVKIPDIAKYSSGITLQAGSELRAVRALWSDHDFPSIYANTIEEFLNVLRVYSVIGVILARNVEISVRHLSANR